MMVPTVNLNGTSKSELLRETREAYDALGAAMKALRNMTVHGRDYHMQEGGSDAVQRALDEHRARLNAVYQVQEELLDYFAAIDKQPGR